MKLSTNIAIGRRSMIKILAATFAAILAAGPVQAQTKIQIGCTATSDCASAMVAVAGASIMNSTSNANIAAFVRNGITIKEPKDFVGKKVGAPGLGAFLHVLL